MSAKSVLCVAPAGLDSGLADALRAADWNFDVAPDLQAAATPATGNDFQVGLLWPGALEDAGWAAWADFAAKHDRLEWVGIFDAQALANPSCRELIVEQLFDHHTVPVDPRHLLLTLGHAAGHAWLRKVSIGERRPTGDGDAIVGRSPPVQLLMTRIRRIAKVDAPVLISGESGSGKELAAQAIHRLSQRAEGPFVAVNCGAIQPSLIQSELFGHVRGAFTGASREKRGLIEAASGGTILLDEIGDLPLELQINLLRFLQESTVIRVGSTQSIHVDARIIAATNVDIERSVAEGTFREDLYYRLNVLPLTVPPLRERRADVEPLAMHFFEKFGGEKSPALKGFSRRAIAAMESHHWPGNVRELVNRVRRAMVMAEGGFITPGDLGLDARAKPLEFDALGEARTKAERLAISSGLQDAGRNVTKAAKLLGVSRMTLYRLMAKHGIRQID